MLQDPLGALDTVPSNIICYTILSQVSVKGEKFEPQNVEWLKISTVLISSGS